MSDKINVIAAFNPIKEIKPIWISRDDKKSKVEKIIKSIEIRGTIFFTCIIDGENIVLCYDINNHQWSIEQPWMDFDLDNQ